VQIKPEVIVLLSGGIDSAACLAFYSELGRPLCALFVDYSQPAATQEIRAATSVASHYKVSLQTLELKGARPKNPGLISGRNAFLICSALMERASSVSVIAIGIHKGTHYRDCSKAFLSKLQSTIEILEPPKVHISAPFLTWSKREIYAYCLSRGVPIKLTYSCEVGGPEPCGNCLSCKDRQMLDAGA
jgi:7-cyano-7-deazaguanine synthase